MNNMKHKILSLLVLLLTAVTGAWAQGAFSSDPYTSTTEFNSVSVKSSMTLNINEGVIVTVNSGLTIEDGVTLTLTGGGRLSVYGKSGAWGRDAFYEEGNRIVEATAGGDGNPAIILNDNAKIVIDNGEIYAEGGQGGFGGADATAGTNQPDGAAGNAFSRFPTIDGATLYYKSSNEWFKYTSGDQTLYNKMKAVPATFEVTTNKAQGETTFTEASFQMPAFDATAEYELVRDMQDATNPVAFSGIPTDGKIFVKKGDDGKYQPAEALNIQLIDPLAATDAQNIIGSSDITIKVLKGDDSTGPVEYDQENPITLDAFLADMKPGFYWIKAEGTTDGAYDGTVYSTEMWLTEAYNLMLNTNPEKLDKVSFTVGGTATTVSKENPIIKNVETGKSVKLSVSEGYMFSDMFTGYKVNFTPAGDALAWTKVGCYYWGDYGNNNIFNPVQWPGVEMQKNGNSWETTINVNGLTNIIFNDFQTNNQQTSDLPFASGAADNLGSYTIADAVEMTYNNAKTEATFSMPASNVGMNFNVKRNLSVKTAAEMAERIRINKTGDTYSPIQMTDVQPTVTNNLDAQNPVVLEFGKDYSTTLQKKGEGQDEWIDTQDYGVGTYRLMVTGNGEYGGTCYTNEFELYAGYEVTVAAGEYITYYSNEALMVEDTDAQLYTVSNVTDTEAVLSDKIKVAPKETPLLVYNKSEESKTFLLIPTDETADEVTPAKEFKGSLTEGEIPASSAVTDYYALNGKAFVWVKYAIEIGANKCWLQIGDQPAAARAMTRSIVGGGDTTNMDDVRWQMEDGNYYDLQGRKVEKPNRKGIYIHNGKKVIVR